MPGRAAPRRLPAARGGRLLVRHRARGRRACAAPRRRCATSSSPPRRSPPSWRREWGPDGDEDGEAKRLARALHGTIPVITGAGLTASVAYRWKTQLNENAEIPAFASKLPEHDHNEIVGWAGAERRLGAVFLDDPEGDERAAAGWRSPPSWPPTAPRSSSA